MHACIHYIHTYIHTYIHVLTYILIYMYIYLLCQNCNFAHNKCQVFEQPFVMVPIISNVHDNCGLISFYIVV